MQGAIHKANLENRRILVIDNPYFSKQGKDLDSYKAQSIQTIQNLGELKSEQTVIVHE